MAYASPLALRLQQAWLHTQLPKQTPAKNSSSLPSSEPSLDYIAHMLMKDDDPEQDLINAEKIQQQLTDLIYSGHDLRLDQTFQGQTTGVVQYGGNRDPVQVDFLSDHEEFIQRIWGPDEMKRMRPSIRALEEPVFYQYDIVKPERDSLSGQNIYGQRYTDIFRRLDLNEMDLLESLIDCARNVSYGDAIRAMEIAEKIRKRASSTGNVSQRLAFYFVEALVVRISSLGGSIYRVLCNAFRNPDTRKTRQLPAGKTPYMRLPHVFATQTILNACKGKKKIHVIDYGILFGNQWPGLIDELSKLPEGPPHFRLTGIDMPPPGFQLTGVITDTHFRLEEYARNKGVPFKYHTVSGKWEEIDPAELFLKEDEVLIVNCFFRHHNLMDDSIVAESPRNIWLSKIRSMNPAVFIQGVKNINYNPFFMSRFTEAMIYHAVIFDSYDHCLPKDHPGRYEHERDKYCREILNAVACEGCERVEWAENYKQSHARTEKAGFEPMPLDPQICRQVDELLDLYDRKFKLNMDKGWMVLSWKDQPVHAYSAWCPQYS